MNVMLEPPVRDWRCPNCGKTAQTREFGLHTQYHPCPKMRGIAAPMVEAHIAAKVELREWQDYVGGEAVQTDPERGRPIQSIVTIRDNGQDVEVFAPTATAKGSAT